MPVKPSYLLIAGGGAVFVWSGVKHKSVTGVFRSLIGGENPAKVKDTGTIGGVTGNAVTQQQVSAFAAQGLPVASGGSVQNPLQAQQFAFSLFPHFGWDQSQEQPLVSLWNQESGWDANAVNASSGAYGIPQALPSANGHPFPLGWGGAKAQILWGLVYIKGRYGSPAGAWQHEQQFNWY